MKFYFPVESKASALTLATSQAQPQDTFLPALTPHLDYFSLLLSSAFASHKQGMSGKVTGSLGR